MKESAREGVKENVRKGVNERVREGVKERAREGKEGRDRARALRGTDKKAGWEGMRWELWHGQLVHDLISLSLLTPRRVERFPPNGSNNSALPSID